MESTDTRIGATVRARFENKSGRMYNSLVLAVAGTWLPVSAGSSSTAGPPSCQRLSEKQKCASRKTEGDFPPEKVGLHLRTQSQTDPISAWSQSSIDPLTSHFTASAVSFVPDLIPFSPHNGPPEVSSLTPPHPPSLLARFGQSFSVPPPPSLRWGGGPRWAAEPHPFIWRWTAWCCGSWPVKVRWGWTWPGSSGLGWSAAPAIGGTFSSRLSAPVRQMIDQRQHVPLWFLNIYLYLVILSLRFLLEMLNILEKDNVHIHI